MNDVMLGLICFSVCVAIIVVVNWMCKDYADEIDEEWERYEREELNK